ncbi:hypothetical protein Baya_12878 [Bagarius yarrelli]|uniref:Uncharacterized protein n=1 Tax=Bagarius yarrelli TaxID=175774 RepID=A0A556V4D6_BAGYA|nr:hypothetical protein Baya_12878 [Bagarius yarrelli]
MSCLHFAAQALNVPSRSVHTSQIRYTPAQLTGMWTSEKNSFLLPRTQILPLVSAERKSQTSFPSIVSIPGPLTHLKPKRSLEVSESRSFLPQLEKPRPPEPSGYHNCGSQISEEKSGVADVCVMKGAVPPSRRLSGSVFLEPPHRHSTEKPSSFPSSSSIPLHLPECSNCKQERKIREEYDKFIIQVKRDRDSLSQRVSELEKELKKRGEQKNNAKLETDKQRAERDMKKQEMATESDETEDEVKTEGEVREISRKGDQTEKEGNNNKCQYRETEKKVVQQGKEKEGEKKSDSTGKESLSTSDEGTEMPRNAEVCLENADLKTKLEAILKKEANSRPCSDCNRDTDTRDSRTHTNVCNSHTHLVSTNTEMLVVSHSVCHLCTSELPQDAIFSIECHVVTACLTKSLLSTSLRLEKTTLTLFRVTT